PSTCALPLMQMLVTARPGSIIAMRAKANVDVPVKQIECRTIILPHGAEGQRASGTSRAVARHRCREGYRTARLLVAGQNIESMQPLHVIAVLFAFGEDKEGVGGEI